MNLNDFTLSRTTAQRKKQDMKEMKKIKKVEERKKKMREANSNPLEGLDSLFQPPMKEVSHFNNLTSILSLNLLRTTLKADPPVLFPLSRIPTRCS